MWLLCDTDCPETGLAMKLRMYSVATCNVRNGAVMLCLEFGSLRSDVVPVYSCHSVVLCFCDSRASYNRHNDLVGLTVASKVCLNISGLRLTVTA